MQINVLKRLMAIFCVVIGLLAKVHGTDNIQVGFLSTPEDHIGFLKRAILTSMEELIIVSPYISCNLLERKLEDGSTIIDEIKKAIYSRNVEVIIYTDAEFDIKKDYAHKGVAHRNDGYLTESSASY